MKKELDTKKASFKFDLMETANVDPMVTPADFKLLAAFVSVMEWPSGKAWLSPTLACAKTGMSDRQYWRSRGRLLGKNPAKRPYLIPARGSSKVASFKLINPWREEAIDHIAAMLGYHKEQARQRKEAWRAKKAVPKTSDLSLTPVQGQGSVGPCQIVSSVPDNFADKYPSVSTPKKQEGREDKSLGSNVVPFKNDGRKAS